MSIPNLFEIPISNQCSIPKLILHTIRQENLAGIIFGKLAVWSIGDLKFRDSPTARDVFNRRTPRLIDGCQRL